MAELAEVATRLKCTRHVARDDGDRKAKGSARRQRESGKLSHSQSLTSPSFFSVTEAVNNIAEQQPQPQPQPQPRPRAGPQKRRRRAFN